MNCPYQTHFDRKGTRIVYECPQHDKKGGCMLWTGYSAIVKDELTEKETTVDRSGCAHKIAVFLQLENTNSVLNLAHRMNQTSAEISSLRCENIKEQQASRAQLIHLAQGNLQLVNADHNTKPINIKD